jgi:hypothetical protein
MTSDYFDNYFFTSNLTGFPTLNLSLATVWSILNNKYPFFAFRKPPNAPLSDSMSLTYQSYNCEKTQHFKNGHHSIRPPNRHCRNPLFNIKGYAQPKTNAVEVEGDTRFGGVFNETLAEVVHSNWRD